MSKDKEQELVEISHKKTNQDITLESTKTFAEAGLSSYLVKCYEKLGYKNPTPIQYYSISTCISKQYPSVIAQSKSGTGKTLSYISTLLTHLQQQNEVSSRCSYLIILPTRELSLQVYQTFKEIINAFTHVKADNEEQKSVRQKLKQIRLMMCIGGIPFEDDKKNYNQNGGTVLVGTIGRVLQFFEKRLIKVNELQMLILDEGDKLFQNKNKRFSELVASVINYQSPDRIVKLLIYSATFTSKLMKELIKTRQYTFIQTLADHSNDLSIKITDNYLDLVDLDTILSEGSQTTEAIINLDNIKKYKVVITHQNQSYFNAKIQVLIQLLQQLKYQRCLVFVEKKTLLQQINERVIHAQLEPLLIHGSLSQSSRIKLMNQINHTRIIIASDLLARGIDLELDLVILFDAKKNDTFWHRIGRTGRFGSMGVAISLDNIEDWEDYEQEQVQGDLDLICGQFKKNKEWYGTYLTEIGRWNETNQQKEIQLQKQYKYFDENTFQTGRKLQKIDEEQPIAAQVHHHQKQSTRKDLIAALNAITSHEQLIVFLRQFAECAKCNSLMSSIESLTGYSFELKRCIGS